MRRANRFVFSGPAALGVLKVAFNFHWVSPFSYFNISLWLLTFFLLLEDSASGNLRGYASVFCLLEVIRSGFLQGGGKVQIGGVIISCRTRGVIWKQLRVKIVPRVLFPRSEL